MELTKRMVNTNGQTVFVVHDGGETYPVFAESLHSKIIFDGLTSSGYEFCGLPFLFKKDGKKIMDMPAETWNITPIEESDMYDLLDADMYTTAELMDRVSEESDIYLTEPETSYTITTREAFIEFLSVFKAEDAFAEFRPINSFVHPEARFTFEEFRSPVNKEYVDILNSYRVFNFQRWKKLVNWINKPLQSFDDVLREYFKWGLDGLYLPIIAEYEKQLTVPEFSVFSSEDRWSSLFYRKEIGLVDNNGTILVPDESKNLKWEFTLSREAIQNKMSQLKQDEVAVAELHTPVKETCFIKDGKEISLHITQSSIYLGSTYYSTLRVHPNGIAMPRAMTEHCIPSRFTEMAEDAYMHSLAADTIRRRVEPCSASSARALELLGLSKHCILNYIVDKLDFSKDNTAEDGIGEITWGHVDAYCRGDIDDGPLKDYLDGILSGLYNIDSIKAARDAITRYSAKTVYEQIYVMHKILGVSIDEIKEKINAMGENDSFTVSNAEGYTFKFYQPINRDVFTAFNLDVQNYRVQAAEQAVEWVYVLTAFRELGLADAKRHVAMACYSVNRMSSKVKMLSSIIEEKFESEVRSKFTNELEVAGWLKDSMYFVGCRYFEAALRGTITYPAKLGGRIERIDADLQSQLRSTLQYKADMLSAICEGNVAGGEFHFFFANAYVTPFYVIPIKNASIQQMDFSVAWRDYSGNPEAMTTLMQREAIPATGFNALENWALDPEYTLTEHDGIGVTDMLGYYDNSLEFLRDLPNNVVYKGIPHPMEYLFPTLYTEDEDAEYLDDSAVRTEPIKFSATSMKTLSMDMFPEVFDISGDIANDNKFKPYIGLNSDDFYNIENPIKALDTVVPLGKRGINVMPPNKFCFSDNVVHDYTELPQFIGDDTSILNIQGRDYIVRDYRGVYYRVEV